MTGIILRIVIFAAIAWFVYSGTRQLWRDLARPFRRAMPPRPAPGVKAEPERIIDLQRDADGVYRPPGGGQRRDRP